MTEPHIDHWGEPAQPSPAKVALDQIAAGLDALTVVDPGFLSVAESKAAITRLAELVSRQQAVFFGLVAAVDSRVAIESGDADAATWMAQALRIDKRVAKAQVRFAGWLTDSYPRLREGLARGVVNTDQARVIVRSLNDLQSVPEVDAEIMGRAEELLLGHCVEQRPGELGRLGRRALEILDPDRFEAAEARRLAREEEAAQRRKSARFLNRGDGTILLEAILPLTEGLRLKTYVDACASHRRHRLLEKGTKIPYDRLRGEALCEMVRRFDPDQLPRHGGDATTVMVTIDYHDLLNDLATARIGFEEDKITAAEARRLACNGAIIPVVLGGDSVPMDMGRLARFFTPMQRRVLRMQHPTCQVEGCDMLADWCEAHHLVPWALGGKTDLKDAALLCPHHHRRAHDPGYLLNRLPDGSIKFKRRP